MLEVAIIGGFYPTLHGYVKQWMIVNEWIIDFFYSKCNDLWRSCLLSFEHKFNKNNNEEERSSGTTGTGVSQKDLHISKKRRKNAKKVVKTLIGEKAVKSQKSQ